MADTRKTKKSLADRAQTQLSPEMCVSLARLDVLEAEVDQLNQDLRLERRDVERAKARGEKH